MELFFFSFFFIPKLMDFFVHEILQLHGPKNVNGDIIFMSVRWSRPCGNNTSIRLYRFAIQMRTKVWTRPLKTAKVHFEWMRSLSKFSSCTTWNATIVATTQNRLKTHNVKSNSKKFNFEIIPCKSVVFVRQNVRKLTEICNTIDTCLRFLSVRLAISYVSTTNSISVHHVVVYWQYDYCSSFFLIRHSTVNEWNLNY